MGEFDQLRGHVCSVLVLTEELSNQNWKLKKKKSKDKFELKMEEEGEGIKRSQECVILVMVEMISAGGDDDKYDHKNDDYNAHTDDDDGIRSELSWS